MAFNTSGGDFEMSHENVLNKLSEEPKSEEEINLKTQMEELLQHVGHLETKIDKLEKNLKQKQNEIDEKQNKIEEKQNEIDCFKCKCLYNTFALHCCILIIFSADIDILLSALFIRRKSAERLFEKCALDEY